MNRMKRLLTSGVLCLSVVAIGAPDASADRIYPYSIYCQSTQGAATLVWASGMTPFIEHYLYRNPQPGTKYQKFYRPAPLQWWKSSMISGYQNALDNNIVTGGDEIDQSRSKVYCATLPTRSPND